MNVGFSTCRAGSLTSSRSSARASNRRRRRGIRRFGLAGSRKPLPIGRALKMLTKAPRPHSCRRRRAERRRRRFRRARSIDRRQAQFVARICTACPRLSERVRRIGGNQSPAVLAQRQLLVRQAGWFRCRTPAPPRPPPRRCNRSAAADSRAHAAARSPDSRRRADSATHATVPLQRLGQEAQRYGAWASTSSAPARRIATASGSGKAIRLDQVQAREPHGLHSARRCADIAGVAGMRQARRERIKQGRASRWAVAWFILKCSIRQNESGGTKPKQHKAGSRRIRPKSSLQSHAPSHSISPSRPRAAPADHQPRLASTLAHDSRSPQTANDFVTEVDKAAEAAIIETLREAYPNHAILAEESGASGGRRRVPVDHRPARRHHQLHPRLSAVRGVDRPGAQGQCCSRPSFTTRTATSCSRPARAPAPSSTTSAFASPSGPSWMKR
jgi:hypothetical protein